jgi:hypothetical protein
MLRRFRDDERVGGLVVVTINGRHIPTILEAPTIRKRTYGSRA